jgi:hypothetical protein
MVKILTIIAQRPDSKPDDPAIQKIWDKLKPSSDATHAVRRASTLQQVKKLLIENELEPNGRLQIVGHGAPGRLWLSGNFTATEVSKDGHPYVLDSNPNFYRVLFRNVAPATRVCLIGCTVGAESAISRIADGPTLLFDLARMWDCDVVASTGYVNATHFGADGVFLETDEVIASARARKVSGTTGVDPGPLPDSSGPTRPGVPTKPTIKFTRLLGPPMIGPASFFRRPKPVVIPPGGSPLPIPVDPRLTRLEQQVEREVDGSTLLAAPELRLSLRIDGEDAKGEVIGNARLLRVLTSKGMRYFEFKSKKEEREALLDTLRAITKEFEP